MSTKVSAQMIAEALACGRRCDCTKTASSGNGKTHCPAHEDKKPSLSITEKGDKVLVNCHAGCEQNVVLEALRERGLWAKRSPNGRVHHQEVRHVLRELDGTHVADHVRLVGADGKKSKGPWWEPKLNGRRTATLPLFGVEALRDLADGAPIIVTEGEPASTALRSLEISSVGTVCGAGVTPSDDSLRPLTRFDLYLWPDGDAPGVTHMANIHDRLVALGAKPKMIRWTLSPTHGDAADFIAQGATAAGLRELMAEAIQELDDDDNDQTADVLLDEVVGFVKQYIVVSDEQVHALAVWVLHTHAIDAFDVTPYLSITSAEKRSGKSRLLSVLSLLTARTWLTGRVTAAVIARKIDAEAPTLLLDESDAAFKSDKEYAEALRGILNSGFEREGKSSICVGSGAKMSYVDLSTFGPKAIAGIGRLPDTIEDRAIRIEMQRKRPGETVERFRRRDSRALAGPLRQRLERWAVVNVDVLREARPQLPDALDDRAADVWEPLLALADLAGGDWPARAKTAALALSTGATREDESLGVRLLTDIRDIFAELRVERLSSADLVRDLNALETSPWGDIKGRPLDARKLARRLKPHSVKPHTIRVGATTIKGYEVGDFEDAFGRYLPAYPEQASQASQPSQTPDSNLADVTDVTDVTDNPGTGQGQLIDDGSCSECGDPVYVYDDLGRPFCRRHGPEDEGRDHA